MSRDRLGLALAGGGFRASLFHIGVLRRLAELDLLRFVEVLSTVSGGSIVGALYILLLKERLEDPTTPNPGKLSHEDYVRIVAALKDEMTAGIAKNLRTRFFMNPFRLLRVMVTQQSLGQSMAHLYEKHIYQRAVARLRQQANCELAKTNGDDLLKNYVDALHRSPGPGAFPLTETLIRPDRFQPNRKDYFDREREYSTLAAELLQSADPKTANTPKRAAATKLVVNATSLNSGARFWFSNSEIGDWFLGHFRADETEILLERRALLAKRPPITIDRYPLPTGTIKSTLSQDTYWLADWWKHLPASKATVPPPWRAFKDELVQDASLLTSLATTDFGYLRRAKVAAHRLLALTGEGALPPQNSGTTDSEDQTRRTTITRRVDEFWDALVQIDTRVSQALRLELEQNEKALVLATYVQEFYWLRTAANVNAKIQKHWSALTVADAVGASACFPPVFPPFQIWQFFDDVYVSRLGLTDGGVYDNTGIDALCDEECTHIVASDTGKHLDTRVRVSTGRLGMFARLSSILPEDVRWHQQTSLTYQRRVNADLSLEITSVGQIRNMEPSCRLAITERLEALRRRNRVRSLAFALLSPKLGTEYVDSEFDGKVAAIRTDLDGFGDVESDVLINQGSLAADHAIQTALIASPYYQYSQACGFTEHAPRASPAIPNQLSTHVRTIVDCGRHSLFRSLRLGRWALCRKRGTWISWVTTMTLALPSISVFLLWLTAALFGAPGNVVARWWSIVSVSTQAMAERLRISIAGSWRSLPSATLTSAWESLARSLAPALRWTNQRLLPLTLLCFVGIVVVLRLDLVSRLKRTTWIGLARSVATIGRWFRGYAANVFWCVYLAPLVISLAASVVAAISHCLFFLPFKHVTAVDLPIARERGGETSAGARAT